MKIVLYPHPALRRPAVPLTSIDQQVQSQVREMFDLMYAAKGLGLAANQVALPYQLLVINLTSDPQQPEHEQVFVNPVITERKGSVEDEEGCLSLPGLYQKVRRAKSIVMRAYNLKGESVEVAAQDMMARVLQHETDHLNGVLFIDKIGPIARLASRNTLKEFERNYKKAQARGEIAPDAELVRQLQMLENQALRGGVAAARST
jgi:peptide deformylase